MKPRVVIQDTATGEFRKGAWSWTKDINLARVWRSEGIARNARDYTNRKKVRYVPVQLTVLSDSQS